MSTDATDLPYRELVEAAPDGVVVYDEAGRIVLVNVEAERMFGYTRAELLGKPVEVVLPQQGRGRRKDGSEIPLEISLSPIATTRGRLVTAGFRDVTERRKLEEELRLAREAAEAASAAKSEFLSSMSHELRTPLNAILGFAQLLEGDRKEPLTDRQLERLTYVLRGGEHLLRLIDDILDLSRIEAGGVTITLEPVSIRDVISEVISTLAPLAARAGISIAPPAPGLSPCATADRTRLAQVFMNYGSNAIKYGREGGHVAFSITTPAGDDTVRVAVRDDGIGIPPDKQAKLFEPFQRAGQETGPIEGTGIGLTITKRLAEMMKGRVGFSSEVGHGSEFWVEIPLEVRSTGELTPLRRAESPTPTAVEGARYKVIYIEDNPSSLAFMRDLLKEVPGLDLVTAPSAELGLELTRAHQPDLVIMDINLPGMDGFEALARLRASVETREIPVIALSAAARPQDTLRARDAGFARYLTKPVRIGELIAALQTLMLDGPGR